VNPLTFIADYFPRPVTAVDPERYAPKIAMRVCCISGSLTAAIAAAQLLFRPSPLKLKEAACKSAVGQRLKRSGMVWSLKGAEPVQTARCAILSGWFDDS
jgi:hypothetical protein